MLSKAKMQFSKVISSENKDYSIFPNKYFYNIFDNIYSKTRIKVCEN